MRSCINEGVVQPHQLVPSGDLPETRLACAQSQKIRLDIQGKDLIDLEVSVCGLIFRQFQ